MQECALYPANFSSRNWHKNVLYCCCLWGKNILPRKVGVACGLCGVLCFFPLNIYIFELRKRSRELLEKSPSPCLYGENLLCMYLWKRKMVLAIRMWKYEAVLRWNRRDFGLVCLGGGVLGVDCAFWGCWTPIFFSPPLPHRFLCKCFISVCEAKLSPLALLGVKVRLKDT